MKYLFLVFCVVAAVTACKSSDSGQDGEGGSSGGNSEALDHCCVLGAICHVTGGADDPEIEECHVLGHKNVQADCEENFERCEAICSKATDHARPHSCQ